MPKQISYVDGGVDVHAGEWVVQVARGIQLDLQLNSIATGAGIGGVTIQLSSTAEFSGTTDSSGKASFNGLPKGKYTITCSGSGSPDPAQIKASTQLQKPKESLVLFAGDLSDEEKQIGRRMLDLGAELKLDPKGVKGVEDVILERRQSFADSATQGSAQVKYLSGTLEDQIKTLAADHLKEVDAEFDNLPAVARDNFKDPRGADERIANDRDYYRWFRPQIRAAGYQPAKLLGSITGVSWNGHQIVAQTRLVELLLQVTNDLGAEPIGRELMAAIAARGAGTGAFCPRPQYGSTVLSNHALGLAIDVEDQKNPIITDEKVLDALKAISGVNAKTMYVVPPGTDHPEDESFSDNLRGAYHAAQEISAKLKEFLKPFLAPPFQKKLKRLEDAQAQYAALAQSPVGAAFAGEEGAKRVRDELDAAKKDVDAVPGSSSFLVLYYSSQVSDQGGVETWAARGILNLPLRFIEKMSDAGFRWGGAYGSRKDYMHFELMDSSRTGPFIAPDEPPQTLKQYVDSVMKAAK